MNQQKAKGSREREASESPGDPLRSQERGDSCRQQAVLGRLTFLSIARPTFVAGGNRVWNPRHVG